MNTSYCDNCGRHRKIVPIRVTTKRLLKIFKIKRYYDPEGTEGVYVCEECKDRMIRTHELKDVSMDDILNDLPF